MTEAMLVRARRRRRALPPPQIDEETREPPTVMSARLVLALARGACDPTVAGVCEYLGVYRSTAFRLLSRLVEAGILVKRQARRPWVPPSWVYSVASEHLRPPKGAKPIQTPSTGEQGGA